MRAAPDDASQIVAVDVGGTHARFAIAGIAGGRVLSLSEATTLKTADHATFQAAWTEYRRRLGRTPPRAVGLTVAGPTTAETLKFTNNPWIIEPASLPEQLGVDHVAIVNDFAAIGHAVAQLPPDAFIHVCGPDGPLPEQGVISIVGPGTGLGVAALLRAGGGYHVVPTEGGHVDFAPVDAIDDQLLAEQRRHHGRVSAERIVSGPGLAVIRRVLAAIEGEAVEPIDDTTLWTRAFDSDDVLAAAALDRFCLALGSVAGDIALAQGATGVVVAGGLGLRLAQHLPRSGFAKRFAAKGRFEAMMRAMPVRLIVHPQPGLYGAAAAFARDNR